MSFLRRFRAFFGGDETVAAPTNELTRARLREIEDRLDQLDRKVKNLTTDWDVAHEKLMHLMARVTKRAAALAKERAEQEAPPEGTGELLTHASGDDKGLPRVGSHESLMAMRRARGLLPR